MAAGVYNFKFEQGVSHSFTIEYKDEEGNPIPIDDYYPEGSIKIKMSDKFPVAFFSFQNLETGKLLVTLEANAFTGIPVKGNYHDDPIKGVYDIYLVKPAQYELAGERIRLLNGTVTISPAVTEYFELDYGGEG